MICNSFFFIVVFYTLYFFATIWAIDAVWTKREDKKVKSYAIWRRSLLLSLKQFRSGYLTRFYTPPNLVLVSFYFGLLSNGLYASSSMPLQNDFSKIFFLFIFLLNFNEVVSSIAVTNPQLSEKWKNLRKLLTDCTVNRNGYWAK